MASDDATAYLDLVLSFFAPILSAAQDPGEATQLLINLGYVPPGDVDAFQSLGPTLGELGDLADTLSTAIAAGDEDAILAAILQLLTIAGKLFQGINAFGAAI